MYPPLLDAGDVRATWARVGTDGLGMASHSNGAESERVGHAEQSRCETWSGVWTRASRQTS
jgi:hypothetical protein